MEERDVELDEEEAAQIDVLGEPDEHREGGRVRPAGEVSARLKEVLTTHRWIPRARIGSVNVIQLRV